MNKPLKQALIDEILRSRNNSYRQSDLELLNEYHLQRLLGDIIIGGSKYQAEDLNEITHVRNAI